MEVQADNGGGQLFGEGLRQQAGRILEELGAACIRGALAVVWLILIVRLVVVRTLPVLIVALHWSTGHNSSRSRGMAPSHRRRIAEAEGEAIEVGDGC